MTKKTLTIFVVTFFLLSLAISSLAADTLKGKVTKIEGDKVTVAIEGTLPDWVKAGNTVTAGGGAPKVLSVKGNEVTLRFSKSKAAKIKPNSAMSVSEFAGDELQGC